MPVIPHKDIDVYSVKEMDIKVETDRGVLLNGVLFSSSTADTIVVCITGVHGNFFSNPFYYNFANVFNSVNIDFLYAQTNDAFNRIDSYDTKLNKKVVIGSYCEDFSFTNDDINAYVNFIKKQNKYKHIILAGHSLGANKVIYYLSNTTATDIEHFILFSPANLKFLTQTITEEQKVIINKCIQNNCGDKMLPFELFGWLPCVANTAYQWLSNNILNNCHLKTDADFSQIFKIKQSGALCIGMYDAFAFGDPVAFIHNINNHFQHPEINKLIFIEKTGHTYQQKEQETAEKISQVVLKWIKNNC